MAAGINRKFSAGHMTTQQPIRKLCHGSQDCFWRQGRPCSFSQVFKGFQTFSKGFKSFQNSTISLQKVEHGLPWRQKQSWLPRQSILIGCCIVMWLAENFLFTTAAILFLVQIGECFVPCFSLNLLIFSLRYYFF